MILKDNLYKIQDTEETPEGVLYRITLNKQSPIYQAHFPQMPITPGACIIQMVEELLADHVKMNLQISSVKNAKFLSMLVPTDDIIMIRFSSITHEDDKVKAQSVVIGESDVLYAKISIICNVQC